MSRILIVDDNADAADAMAMLLDLKGHEVQTAADGHKALEGVESFEPDVVLLDLGLPGMDGLEVARAVREREGERHVRLIAVTGWGQDSDKDRTREAGFDAHVTKPVDIEELTALLG